MTEINGTIMAQDTESTPLKKKNLVAMRALIAYWILGLCNNYGYVVMLSAAHDILHDLSGHDDGDEIDSENVTTVRSEELVRQCNELSTGAILLADIVPALIIKGTAPFLPFYVHVRVGLCILLGAAGFLLVAFATTEALAIAGVVCTSLASGFGEVSFLQYSAFYSKNVVSTWSSGTGGAGILGSISYAGLANLGLKTALLIMLVVPITMAVAFWIILPAPDEKNAQFMMETSRVEGESSLKKKMKLIPGLMIFMIPLMAVYFLEYFINQGLFELVQFENSSLSFKEQYHWLQVDYQVGVFLSRSSVNLFHIRRIWFMAVLQLINVLLFTFEAIYYFIPSIWIVFVLTLWEGLLGGAAYVNTFYRISQEVPEDRKQFSMSVTSLADTIGITLAGIAALPVHNAICDLPKPTRLTF